MCKKLKNKSFGPCLNILAFLVGELCRKNGFSSYKTHTLEFFIKSRIDLWVIFFQISKDFKQLDYVLSSGRAEPDQPRPFRPRSYEAAGQVSVSLRPKAE